MTLMFAECCRPVGLIALFATDAATIQFKTNVNPLFKVYLEIYSLAVRMFPNVLVSDLCPLSVAWHNIMIIMVGVGV